MRAMLVLPPLRRLCHFPLCKKIDTVCECCALCPSKFPAPPVLPYGSGDTGKAEPALPGASGGGGNAVNLSLTIPIIGFALCYNVCIEKQMVRRMDAMKDWDFGYFGKGIDGYVHYMQAFHRNFPQSSRPPEAKRAEQKPKEEESLLQSLAELGGLFMIIVLLLGVLSLLQ